MPSIKVLEKHWIQFHWLLLLNITSHFYWMLLEKERYLNLLITVHSPSLGIRLVTLLVTMSQVKIVKKNEAHGKYCNFDWINYQESPSYEWIWLFTKVINFTTTILGNSFIQNFPHVCEFRVPTHLEKLLFYHKPGKWGLRSAHWTIKTWKNFSVSQKYIFITKFEWKASIFTLALLEYTHFSSEYLKSQLEIAMSCVSKQKPMFLISLLSWG